MNKDHANSRRRTSKAFRIIMLLLFTGLAPLSIAGDGEITFIHGFEGTGNVPQFVGVDDQAIAAETLLALDLDTSDPVGQAGLAWSLDPAPNGMTINPSSGVLRWTPTRAQLGTHPVTVRVEDLAGLSNTLSFDVLVIDISSAPLIESISDRSVEANVPLQLQVVAVDPDPDDVVEFTLDAAPPGMLVDPFGGLIEWLPETGDIGSYTVTVRATDSGGQFDVESFDVTVIEENTTPILDPIADRGAAPAVEFQIQASASDPDPGDSLRWSLRERPAGMSIDPDTGLLRWTPTALQLGPHSVTVAVADSFGATDQTGFEILVDLNRPPVAIDDTGYRVERGDTLSVAAPGVLANDEDPNDDPLTAQLESSPQRGSLMLNPDGSFDYTPDSPIGTIGLVEKWNHSQSGGLNYWPPIVVDIDDDPQPEVLMLEAQTATQTVRSLDGISGEVEWEISFGFLEIAAEAKPSVADIDLDGRLELILIGGERHNAPYSKLRLIALTHDGHIQWISEELPEWFYRDGLRRGNRQLRAAAIKIADLDQDGTPEIIAAPDNGPVGFHVWDHEGRTLASVQQLGTSDTSSSATRVMLVDLDLDGDLEIVVGDTAWHHDGSLIWTLGLTNSADSTFPIVVNLDDDPFPELVRTRGPSSFPDNPGDILAINHDGSILWEVSRPGVTVTAAFDTAPMTAADVNGDGYADILRTYPNANSLFEVLDGRDGTTLWSKTVPTRFSGATAIDFDRDGFVEVVLFGGDSRLYVWDGRDGTDKGVFDTFTSAPSPNTLPVFADIDVDGHAELLLSIAGAFSTAPAIIAFESPNDDWPPMRSVWNQMRYQVTNINTVPDLSGLTETQALAVLAAQTLRADPLRDTFSDSVATGVVAGQIPAAGSPVAAGGSVEVRISRGPVPVDVPRLVGLDLEDAVAALSSAGLAATPIEWVNDDRTPRGLILQQDPPPTARVPPASDVALVVSGGPRAVIRIDPPLIPAGNSEIVTVEVRDIDGTLLDPQPDVTLSLQIDPGDLFGSLPTLVDDTIDTAADSQGEFEVVASFNTRGAETVAARAAVLPPISDGPGGTIYTEFTRQLAEFNRLIPDLIDAVDGGDGTTILALDSALGELEQAIDIRRLRTMTAIAPEGGVPPNPTQADGGGLISGIFDNAYVDISLELVVLLKALDGVVREGTAPDLILNQLNQELAATASALVADIRAVRQSLRDEGVIAADGTAQPGRFTLPGIMAASQIRQTIITDFYVPYLGQVARTLGTVIGADLLQPYVNGGSIVGIITGSSLAIHVFEIPNSVIEGFGFDPRLSPNNAVTMVGPTLIDSVTGALGARLIHHPSYCDTARPRICGASLGRASSPDRQVRLRCARSRNTPSAGPDSVSLRTDGE